MRAHRSLLAAPLRSKCLRSLVREQYQKHYATARIQSMWMNRKRMDSGEFNFEEVPKL